MRKNIKKILLLSAFTFQIFGGDAFAATAPAMGDATAVDALTSSQKTAYPTYYIGDPTLRAIADSLGFPNTGTSNSQPIASLLTGISTTASGLLTTSTFTTATANPTTTGPALSGQVGTVITGPLTTAINALPSVTTMTIPLKLTTIVDNIINSAFNADVLTNSSFKFPGANTISLSSTDSSGAYVITGGTPISKLFSSSGPAINATVLSPAAKLSIFLRAVFGINYTTYKAIDIPSTGTPYFDVFYSDCEDAGLVLTSIFDCVLGTSRNAASGTNGNNGNPTNAWGGAGIFNRINAAANPSTATLYPYGATTPSTNATALTTPLAYFNFVLGGNGTSSSSSDIMRLKCLIQDLIVPASS